MRVELGKIKKPMMKMTDIFWNKLKVYTALECGTKLGIYKKF